MSSQDQDEALETVSSFGKAEEDSGMTRKAGEDSGMTGKAGEDSGMTGELRAGGRPAGQLRSVGHSHKTADPALLPGVGKPCSFRMVWSIRSGWE